MTWLGDGERCHLIDGIRQDIRNDGRGRGTYRPWKIERGYVPQTNGSARLTLAGTEIIVGVQAELATPTPELPDCGRVQVQVKSMPRVLQHREGQSEEAVALEAERLLETLLNGSNGLDLTKLCLTAGYHCWLLHIDCTVLTLDGNLVDTLSLAVRAALEDTVLPNVNINAGERKGKYEIEIAPFDPNSNKLDVSSVPIFVTLAKVGELWLIDCTNQEELCSSSMLSVGVKPNGNITIVQKQGIGGLGVVPSAEMIQEAANSSTMLFQKLDEHR